jgi:excisionase family DNA binding protein
MTDLTMIAPPRKRGRPLQLKSSDNANAPIAAPSPPAIKRRAYSIAEFEQISGLSKPTIYRRIADGSITITKIGGRTLIREETVRQLLGETSA